MPLVLLSELTDEARSFPSLPPVNQLKLIIRLSLQSGSDKEPLYEGC
jgi:hypothetical protein